MINVVRMLTVDEGLRNRAYKDDTGKTTVGIGFNMDDPHARGVWIMADIPESFRLVYQNQSSLSTQSAWALLNTNVQNCKKDLKTLLPDFDNHPDNVQLALINLIFNMGLPVFSEFKQFLGFIAAKDYTGAANDLAVTKWATEVPERCMRVCALLKGDDSLYNQG